MIKMVNKRGSMLQEVIIHIVLVGIIFVLFLFATADKASSRAVKGQVIEKQLALLIGVAEPGMEFSINKLNLNGNLGKLEIKGGEIFAYVDRIEISEGYPYFSKYDVSIKEEDTKFVVWVE